jgi:WD40 repeat protein
MKLWDARTWTTLGEGNGHAGTVTSLAFLPGSGKVVSVGSEGILKTWAPEKGLESGKETSLTDLSPGCARLAVSPDGSFAACVSFEGRSLELLDLRRVPPKTCDNEPLECVPMCLGLSSHRVLVGKADSTVSVFGINAPLDQETDR